MAVVSDEIIDLTVSDKILYTKITIMTFNFTIVDEITGVVIGDPSYTNDSTSDIRRTMTIQLHPLSSKFNIEYGSSLWMDKYVKVEIGNKKFYSDDITYINMGVYIINNPSRVYSATENIITLNCLDLMARLTEIRGGVIEGMDYVIPAGSNVRDVIIATLSEGSINRYIVEECSVDVPNDITISGGGTLYDILRELVNLMPNYQIYFDVDGVFHYNMIPSGKNEPIMVDDTVWQQTYISYNVNYDFENVKNCVEVLGGTHDNCLYTFLVDYALNPQFDNATESTVITNVIVRLESGIDADTFKQSLYKKCFLCFIFDKKDTFSGICNISSFTVQDSEGTNIETFNFMSDSETGISVPININNSDVVMVGYCVYNEVIGSDYEYYTGMEYFGGYQPHYTLYETNTDSPFYTGINYYCQGIYDAEGGSNGQDLVKIYSNETYESFDDSIVGKSFQYYLPTTAPSSINDVTVDDDGNIEIEYYFLDIVTNRYTLYYTGNGQPKMALSGSKMGRFNNSYYFVPYESNSVGTLRIVLSGDEYDKIYSDDLAKQRAEFELYQRCRLLDSITITTTPIYWLDTNWLVEITLPTENNGEAGQYLIKTINTTGGVDGTQTITMMKYYPYYDSSRGNLIVSALLDSNGSEIQDGNANAILGVANG